MATRVVAELYDPNWNIVGTVEEDYAREEYRAQIACEQGSLRYSLRQRFDTSEDGERWLEKVHNVWRQAFEEEAKGEVAKRIKV